MKKTAMLFPLMGIELDGASIRFGMTAAEVEDMLGPAENTHNNRRYYFGGELALDFDGAGGLNFMEFLGGREGALQPELYEIPVFQTDAEEVLDLIRGRGHDVEDEDGGYTCTVPALSLGFYREITPADVEELVRAMSRMDVTNLSQVDLDGEQRRANHWETVGIGQENYYA